jgi:hypothetical protein
MMDKIEVVCECGAKLHAPADMLGKMAKCPKCGVAVKIEAIPPSPEPPKIEPPAVVVAVEIKDEPKREHKSEGGFFSDLGTFVLMLMTIAFFITAFVNLGQSFDLHPEYDFHNRFQSDNAVGATANAVERLAATRNGSIATWVIAALLCLILLNLGGLRQEVRALQRKRE